MTMRRIRRIFIRLLPLLCFLTRLPSSTAEVIDVVDHGAVGDGITDDTAAIQRALKLASSTTNTTSTTILFPWGKTFLTGPFNLTDNMTLRVDGTIRAINGYSFHQGQDYIHTKWPQLPPLPSYGNSRDGPYLQHQAVVYAINCTNIRISGTGTIDGGGMWWWDHQCNRTLIPAGRPNLIQVVNCTHVTIDSITLRDSPFWTVHPIYCTNVHVHHTTIRARMYAPNVDGIDPDSCRHVMIENNDVSVGDDHIAIKAGVCGTSSPLDCRRPEFMNQHAYLTENITVRNNMFRVGMGIAVGSESSGSVRDVNIYNNVVGFCNSGHCNDTCCGWGPALHIKTTPTRGGVIENIMFRNNTVYNNTSFIFVEMNYQTGHDDEVPSDYPPTLVRNISFVNNHALGGAVGASFSCVEKDSCEDVVVVNNTVKNAANHNIWSCKFIRSFEVSGNSPPGLEECMEQSMNHTHALALPFESRPGALLEQYMYR